jgi:type II secretory pathway pseudopilin PulG
MPIGKLGCAQRGFVYIALLIGLAIISIGLAAVADVWTHSRQREREEELLFTGQQIRQAISRFYLLSPPAARRFPNNLDELVNDTRAPDKPLHHMRRKYLDPMTSNDQWGEVRLPGGQLVGVYSLSSATPIKSTGFALRDKEFAGKERYDEWIFRSALPAANPVLGSGAGYTTQGPQPVPQGFPGKPPASPLLRPSR